MPKEFYPPICVECGSSEDLEDDPPTLDQHKTRALCASCLPLLELPSEKGGIDRVKHGKKMIIARNVDAPEVADLNAAAAPTTAAVIADAPTVAADIVQEPARSEIIDCEDDSEENSDENNEDNESEDESDTNEDLPIGDTLNLLSIPERDSNSDTDSSSDEELVDDNPSTLPTNRTHNMKSISTRTSSTSKSTNKRKR